ncbi:hypothetical protein HDU97_006237 [Phlyctochytrium planicorne]|nr:hypothetical protein HDU97_006237 [Phlyctochytrium planicorne]
METPVKRRSQRLAAATSDDSQSSTKAAVKSSSAALPSPSDTPRKRRRLNTKAATKQEELDASTSNQQQHPSPSPSPPPQLCSLSTDSGSASCTLDSNVKNEDGGSPPLNYSVDTTTDAAIKHLLKMDSRFKSLYERSGASKLPFSKTCSDPAADNTPPDASTSNAKDVKPIAPPLVTDKKCAFQSLCRSIIYQQLNGKVAYVIMQRFIGIFTDEGETEAYFPTPQQVVDVDQTMLLKAGLSTRKAEYLKELAKAFFAGNISTEALEGMTDQEISDVLIKIKGIGQWTIDMFLIFTLNRPNVLAVGDLAVRKGMNLYFGKSTNAALPSPEQMEKWAEVWVPYRSYGTWYMWRLCELEKEDGFSLKSPAKKKRKAKD